MQNQVDQTGNFPKVGKKPKFSDLEIISLNLVSEYLSIDSENLLFKKLENEHLNDFPNLIDRTQYNRRKKTLFNQIELIRKHLSSVFAENEDVFIIDSMPLEICCNVRASRMKIFKEDFLHQQKRLLCISKSILFWL